MRSVYDKIQLGNLDVGDSITFKSKNGSSMPYGFAIKIENTRAKTMELSEDKKYILENLVDCDLDSVELNGNMRKEQLKEYIKNLKILYNQLED